MRTAGLPEAAQAFTDYREYVRMEQALPQELTMIYQPHSRTRHSTQALSGLAIAGLLFLAPHSSAQSLFGFDADSSAQQRQMEAQFDTYIDTAEMDRWLKDFSSEAHHVGSPKLREN